MVITWPLPVALEAVTMTLNVPAGVVAAPGIAGGGLLTQPAHVTTSRSRTSTGATRASRASGIQRRNIANNATAPTHNAANGAGAIGPDGILGTMGSMDTTQFVCTVTSTVGVVGPPRVMLAGLTVQIVDGAAVAQLRFNCTTNPCVPVMLSMYCAVSPGLTVAVVLEPAAAEAVMVAPTPESASTCGLPGAL